MDYRELIEHDDLTGLDYVDPTIYLDELNKGNIDESTIDINLTRLLSNMTIIDYFGKIDLNLTTYYSWVYFLTMIPKENITHDEIVYIKSILDNLHPGLSYEYKCSIDRENTIWSYVSITMDDLFNEAIKSRSIVIEGLTVDKMLNDIEFGKNLFTGKGDINV